MNKKLLIYVLMTLIVPTLTSELLSTFFEFNFGSPIVNVLILSLAIILLILIVELIVYFFPRFTGKSKAAISTKIKEISAPYKLPSGKPFYTEDSRLLAALASKDSYKKLPLLSYTFFFVVMVREYFSWIEFVNLTLLAKLGRELDIEVVIILESNESSLDSSTHRARDAARFKAEEETYKRIITSIFGGKVTIRSDSYYRKSDSKKYALEFHTLYVKRVLGYVRELEEGKIDYSALRHRFAYLEAIFPIICAADKNKSKEVLFILDRESSKETWSSAPLKDKIEKTGIYFINAATLDADESTGKNPVSMLNLLAPHIKIKEQLSVLSDKSKQTILYLLRAATDDYEQYDENKDVEITMIIQKIKAKYNI